MHESSSGQGRNDLPGDPALAYPVLDLKGEIRRKPEDFRVSEELGFSPDGDGEHLLLRIRKTGRNTTWVASYLARQAGVPARDIGFSGMKDRHAVTEQWYSLPARQGAAIDREDLLTPMGNMHGGGAVRILRSHARLCVLSGDEEGAMGGNH